MGEGGDSSGVSFACFGSRGKRNNLCLEGETRRIGGDPEPLFSIPLERGPRGSAWCLRCHSPGTSASQSDWLFVLFPTKVGGFLLAFLQSNLKGYPEDAHILDQKACRTSGLRAGQWTAWARKFRAQIEPPRQADGHGKAAGCSTCLGLRTGSDFSVFFRCPFSGYARQKQNIKCWVPM